MHLRAHEKRYVRIVATGVIAFMFGAAAGAVWGQVFPSDPEVSKRYAACVRHAQGLIERGSYAEAEAVLGEAIELAPECSAAYLLRGISFEKRGEATNAVRDFTSAIERDPRSTGGYWHRGLVRAAERDFNHAIMDLTIAADIDPDESATFYMRGSVWGVLGKGALALADFDEAIRLDASNPDNYVARGKIREGNGDHAAALADYRAAWKLSEDHFDANHCLAFLLATCPDVSLRDLQAAVNHAKKSCELSGWTNWETIALLATTHAQSEDFPNAIRFQGEALRLAPVEKRAELERRLALYESGKRPYEAAAKGPAKESQAVEPDARDAAEGGADRVETR